VLRRSDPHLLFAINSHGLGHLTRSLAIAREIQSLCPRVQLTLSTAAPKALIAQELSSPFTLRSVEYEPGAVQQSCFETSPTRTRQAYRRFVAERIERLRDEEHYLRATGCTAVISDISALAVRAAANLGLPAVGVSNFTWDWITEPYFGEPGAEIPQLLADDYSAGTLHLRLPFGPENSPFPRAEPAPLVCRRSRIDARELRRRLDIPTGDGRALAVVCFGGWEPSGWQSIRVVGCEGFRFLTVGDLPIRADAPLVALPHALPAGVCFPDLVAGADVVIAKAGYGIASECAAHRTPLVVVERTHFREAPTLIEAFRKGGRIRELSRSAFFAGDWERSLREIVASDRSWTFPTENGARRLALRLAELLELGRCEGAEPTS